MLGEWGINLTRNTAFLKFPKLFEKHIYHIVFVGKKIGKNCLPDSGVGFLGHIKAKLP